MGHYTSRWCELSSQGGLFKISRGSYEFSKDDKMGSGVIEIVSIIAIIRLKSWKKSTAIFIFKGY